MEYGATNPDPGLCARLRIFLQRWDQNRLNVAGQGLVAPHPANDRNQQTPRRRAGQRYQSELVNGHKRGRTGIKGLIATVGQRFAA